MSRHGRSDRSWGRTVRRILVIVVGTGMFGVAMAGLGIKAVGANRTVSDQHAASTVHNAVVDDAFYDCVNVQVHSLVTPGQPVILGPRSFDTFITLMKAVGSWVTFADPPSTAVAVITLQPAAPSAQACLGVVAVATYASPRHRPVVRIGTGADVPGVGPPPLPPL